MKRLSVKTLLCAVMVACGLTAAPVEAKKTAHKTVASSKAHKGAHKAEKGAKKRGGKVTKGAKAEKRVKGKAGRHERAAATERSSAGARQCVTESVRVRGRLRKQKVCHNVQEKQRETAAPVRAAQQDDLNNSGRGMRTNSTVKRCSVQKVKVRGRLRNKRVCHTEEVPLTGGAPDAVQTRPEMKARTLPDRAYAVDGFTFFHQGRKYRIAGVDENNLPPGSDLAKQRLQMALDSGAVSLEPQSVDAAGTVLAKVRVGGKDVADVLNAK